MKKTRIKEAVVGVAVSLAVTVMGGTYLDNGGRQPEPQETVSASEVGPVGRIIPVNLHIGQAKFSSTLTQQECCGPYAQKCPGFKCAAPY